MACHKDSVFAVCLLKDNHLRCQLITSVSTSSSLKCTHTSVLSLLPYICPCLSFLSPLFSLLLSGALFILSLLSLKSELLLSCFFPFLLFCVQFAFQFLFFPPTPNTIVFPLCVHCVGASLQACVCFTKKKAIMLLCQPFRA